MDNYLKTLVTSLGEAIQNDPVAAEYLAAKAEYSADAELGAALAEYNVQKMLLDEQRRASEKNETLIESIEDRANLLYTKIMDSDKMKNLAVAESRMNELLNEINRVLMSYITPERGGGGCGSSGGGCGGCKGCG